ncbi:hypothetical protein GP486_003934 [Trichoglossum hirsutum]|uniref:F-box domain-containing protein n=1 Tax=Trichoglossum hirsutum TaxID=265104 RepID=A0A9P8LBY2_9PEZI|nr:hypothetical protein GP486_003934 [Trichoglossum hirsutum]
MSNTGLYSGPLGRGDHGTATSRPEDLEDQRQQKSVPEQACISKSSGKAFPFFSLPPEVRRIIYRELFFVGEIEIAGWVTTQSLQDKFDLISRSTGFLRVCRQAYREAKHVLYGENSFNLKFLYFLGNLGGTNIMSITTLSIFGTSTESGLWADFCAQASAMPLRSLKMNSIYNSTSQKSSVGATWVKDLARISSLAELSFSFNLATTDARGNLQCELAPEFIDYLQQELEKTKGEVSCRKSSQGPKRRLCCCGPFFPSTVETFTMGSTSKFTLTLRYFLTNRHDETDDFDAHANDSPGDNHDRREHAFIHGSPPRIHAGEDDMVWDGIEGGDMEGSDVEGNDMEGFFMEGYGMGGYGMEGYGMEGDDMEGGDMEDMEGGGVEGGDVEGSNAEGGVAEGGDVEGGDIEE